MQGSKEEGEMIRQGDWVVIWWANGERQGPLRVVYTPNDVGDLWQLEGPEVEGGMIRTEIALNPISSQFMMMEKTVGAPNGR